MQSKTINSSIKIVKYFIGLFILATINTGCNKDACDKIKCLNGGTCIDGTCKCPGGYSGPNCENYDPCYNINCLNGGTCANGFCNCPTGYGGSNCGTALQLKSVTITKIIVNNFPTTNRIGQIAYYWDPGSTSSKYPDIYISIDAGTSGTGKQSSAIYTNVNSVPETYTVTYPTLPTITYIISLYDYDGISDAPDFMGGIYFKPIDFKNGYPPTIRLYNSTNHIDYTVYVTWNF